MYSVSGPVRNNGLTTAGDDKQKFAATVVGVEKKMSDVSDSYTYIYNIICILITVRGKRKWRF